MSTDFAGVQDIFLCIFFIATRSHELLRSWKITEEAQSVYFKKVNEKDFFYIEFKFFFFLISFLFVYTLEMKFIQGSKRIINNLFSSDFCHVFKRI